MILIKFAKHFLYLYKKLCWIKRGVIIESHVICSKGVELGDHVRLCHHAQICFSNIGAKTTVSRYTKIQYADIGKFCSISWDVTIGALDHPVHSISMHAFPWNKNYGILKDTPPKRIKQDRVTIGNDVWVGCGAIIMPRIKIGDGAIIGAGSVVTHDVKPYEIVAGSPARHIKWRFNEDIRNALLSSEWWNWSDQKIHDNIDLFSPYVDISERADIVNQLSLLANHTLT